MILDFIFCATVALFVGLGVCCVAALIVFVIEAISEWRDKRREKQQFASFRA